MNLNQLQYFKILAQEEHYTRAARDRAAGRRTWHKAF